MMIEDCKKMSAQENPIKPRNDLSNVHLELERLKDEYHTFYLYNPTALLTLNADLTIEQLNFKCANLFKLPRQYLLKQSFLNFFTFTSQRLFRQKIDLLLQKNTTQYCELELLHKDGREFVNCTLHTQKYAILVSLEVITTYRQLESLCLQQEKELLCLTHQLQQATPSKAAKLNVTGELISALAHEINQPLTAILLHGQSCLLEMKKESKENHYQFTQALEQIVLQASHAGEIIHRMKNFMHEGTLYLEETDIHSLLHESLAVFEILYPNLKFNFKLCENLPMIKADKIKIMQVISNLIRNSIEAIQDQQLSHLEISMETICIHNEIVFHCRDNGPGIPKNHMSKILNSYFTTKPRGTGLGLAICRSLIEAHGGKFIVQDHDEIGAWLTFTLPIH